ncbi:MAG TPA: sigma-70 family RNA polymerase sigma factor [Acidimicrobiia bacterium]|nr:sigma-70 family RNA polymerase sigma factor [Acidimicrobiia bacterium]
MTLGDAAFRSVLAAAKSGADWAWSNLFRDLFGPVTGYLASRGASEPEDTASEVFLKVASNIHDFEGDEASFRSWVFVIAHRSLIDDRRHRSRRPDLASALPDTASEGGNVEDEAVDSLVTAELLEAFELLTDTQRDVLALRIVAGLSVDQTAQVLGKRTGAVKALQHRALASLRRELDLSDVSK